MKKQQPKKAFELGHLYDVMPRVKFSEDFIYDGVEESLVQLRKFDYDKLAEYVIKLRASETNHKSRILQIEQELSELQSKNKELQSELNKIHFDIKAFEDLKTTLKNTSSELNSLKKEISKKVEEQLAIEKQFKDFIVCEFFNGRRDLGNKPIKNLLDIYNEVKRTNKKEPEPPQPIEDDEEPEEKEEYFTSNYR